MRRSPFFILLIAGILFAVCGVGYGLTSHEVKYQSVGKGTIAHYLSANGTGYLQIAHSPTLYIVHETSFSPTINGIHTFADGDTIAFVYAPDTTSLIDVTSKLGTHLRGNAYNVVEITGYSSPRQVYTTSSYTQNIQGYYKNNWLFGGILIVAGLFLIVLSFLFRGKNKPAVAIEPKQPSFQNDTFVAQAQSLQSSTDITEQSTAPQIQAHLPMPSFPAPFSVAQAPSTPTFQPVLFTNQRSSSNPPSFSGLPSLPRQSSGNNPSSFSGLLSSYKQQTPGNSPTGAGQSAPYQPLPAAQQQSIDMPQLSFDQSLPYQQVYPQQMISGQAPTLQEPSSSPFAHYAHYPQGGSNDTTQIVNPPSQLPQQ